HAPSIVFIDEIDAIGTKRYDSTSGGEREIRRTMLELLNQLDGFDSRGDVKVIMATNRIESLEPALIRPGRIDRKIEFPLPDMKTKRRIFNIHTSRMTLADDVDSEEYVTAKDDLSGADVLSPRRINPPSHHQLPRTLLFLRVRDEIRMAIAAHAEWQPPQMRSRLSSTTKPTTHHLMTTSGHNMMQLEHDHQGADYTVNVKAVNPNPIDSGPSWAPATKKNDASLTGIYLISYLQAVSRSLAVGPMPGRRRARVDIRHALRPTSLRAPTAKTTVPAGMQSPFPPVHPKNPTQVFTATLAPSTGLLHASYWRRLNQSLEVSAEAPLLASKASHMGEGRREGIATVAFKLDTISSTIREQSDTQGRLGAVLEERIAPGISLQRLGCSRLNRGKADTENRIKELEEEKRQLEQTDWPLPQIENLSDMLGSLNDQLAWMEEYQQALPVKVPKDGEPPYADPVETVAPTLEDGATLHKAKIKRASTTPEEQKDPEEKHKDTDISFTRYRVARGREIVEKDASEAAGGVPKATIGLAYLVGMINRGDGQFGASTVAKAIDDAGELKFSSIAWSCVSCVDGVVKCSEEKRGYGGLRLRIRWVGSGQE
ncbi:26S proteasome regulatory subunit 4, partial [Borealophlyctis nickersoniae]